MDESISRHSASWAALVTSIDEKRHDESAKAIKLSNRVYTNVV
jgi:hypothetical protein